MHYRRITPDDLPSIFEVRVKTWHNPNGSEEMARMGINPDSVRQMLETTHHGWLAETNGDVVGFVMGNKQTAEMWVIAVLKEFENLGIGKSLMRLVEDWLVSEGCDRLWLTTDTDESYRAVGFYRHLGWIDCKMEKGDIFMTKRSDQVVADQQAARCGYRAAIKLDDKIEHHEVIDQYRANGWSSADKPTELLGALRNSHSLVTARIDSKLVGIGNAISDGYLVVYYPHLLVHPDHQGQGIGRAMMECLQTRYAGFHQQMLTADGKAIEFYKQLGFSKAGQTESMWIYSGTEH
ncbi:MAG: GNAT family N-acetyltransferase [Verrucomicrobiales bacterium]|nr:GNAT family N-acetyltransferase [Verrucomicrobiales bacterium]